MLSINIWDLLWTFVDFFVLYFLLKKFLFKPIVSFMDARQEKIDAGLDEKRRAQELAAADKAALEEEKTRCRMEAKRILDENRAGCDAKQAELTKKLREDSAHSRLEMRDKLENLREREKESFRQSESELAELLAAQLLKEQRS